MKNFYKIFTILSILIFGSCTDQFDTIQKYLDEGETIYASKLDSLVIRAGHDRVQVVGLLMYGRDTEKCLIKWMPDNDSVFIPVTRVNQIDTFRVFIENLKEGTYDFEITTFDKQGNKSIVQKKMAKTYGDVYMSTLLAREVQQIDINGKNLKVTFAPEVGDSINSEFIYENSAGEWSKIPVPFGTAFIDVTDWKSLGKYKVTTSHIPELNAVDTFKVCTPEGSLPEKIKTISMVDKSGFKELILPGDIALNAWGGSLSKAWDGDITSGNFAHSDNTSPVTFPAWFTFDIGKLVTLSRFELNHIVRADLNYNAGNMKTWEIWGRADKPTDGSWDGWTKLLECNSFKPSGSPVGTNTAEDIEYIKNGEKFEFPAGLPHTRYLRIKVLDSWSGQGFIHFSEFSVYEEAFGG